MLDALTILSGFIALSVAVGFCVLDMVSAQRGMDQAMKHMLGGRDDA